MTSEFLGVGWKFPVSLDNRGQIALARYEESIRQAIWIILSTAPGERAMRPDFGCRIHELVFAPNNITTAGMAARYVDEALGRWEPRIELQRVDANPDPDDPARLVIVIEYRVSDRHSNRSLVYPFYLIPEEKGG